MMLFKLSPADQQDWDDTVKTIWFVSYIFCVFTVFCESFNQFVGHYGGELFGTIALLAEASLNGLFWNPNKNKKNSEETETDNAVDNSDEDTAEQKKAGILLVVFLAEFLLFSIALLYGGIAQIIH